MSRKKKGNRIKDLAKKQANPRVYGAIQLCKKNGMNLYHFRNLASAKQVKFVYYYLTNGFNASQAVLDAGYDTSNPAQVGHKVSRIPHVAAAIAEGIEKYHGLDNKITIGLNKLLEVDIADYEPYLEGEMSLRELRDSGVDTTVLEFASKGVDKYGNPWGKIGLPNKQKIYDMLFKMRDKARKHAENIKIDNMEQNITIITNVPSYHDRKQEEEIVDVDIVDDKQETEKDN